ncbi:MAG: ABC transporter substrate-binding protein [Myxococcales bacterium]|nr:ABC transporter substrate-binding protein [Myxococcales bacterium]HQY60423.1 helical backbone metal receptor [Polyangiaceae bacterium]
MTRGLSRRGALVGALALGVGCARSTQATRGSDAGAAPRVVSLGPATTEALFAIGAGSRVVGRSRFCDKPPEARALPSIGGLTDPNLEAILALRPTLVVGVRGPAGAALVAALEARGVQTYVPEAESKSQIVELIHELGARTGCTQGATTVVAALERTLAEVRASVAGRAHPRVLLLFGRTPLVAAGSRSFPDEMLALAGLDNACSSRERYPTIELERVLAMDPDVVLDASMEGDDASYFSGAGWRRARAVRERRVLRVTDVDVLRPGPSLANGVATLARMVHGTTAGAGNAGKGPT